MESPLALYRRYRPETFAEVIGQDHVTEPLRAALAANRVNHAYLFSGPRGCGKTTSARILARALNCEQAPVADPCGECDSCRDLARGGPGSIDVIEIDAASHGGVDDARDLREKAFFAPVRSRYKVYIIDEAHMVSTQGFNALLKLVEEPPPHLRFIFATTEPEKVLPTIRSRTHHYPFRLIPPRLLSSYLSELCEKEQVTIEPAALPLVVRAGGGSARDTLSVLDQLMGGAGPEGITYALAAGLLGYTPDTLLDEVVDAFAAGDGSAVFGVVDKVIETGQDPRRFTEDLLRRLRDLVIVSAVPDAPATGLIDIAEDAAERLVAQAARFGPAELSRAADLVATGLTEMRGATAPRLLLELICARVLLPGADHSTEGVQARLDRLERRMTIAGGEPGRPGRQRRCRAGRAGAERPPVAQPVPAEPVGRSRQPVRRADARARRRARAPEPAAEPAPAGARRRDRPEPAPAAVVETAAGSPLSLVDVRRLWPDIVEATKQRRRVTWIHLTQHAQVVAVDGEVLTLGFGNVGCARVVRQRRQRRDRAAGGDRRGRRTTGGSRRSSTPEPTPRQRRRRPPRSSSADPAAEPATRSSRPPSAQPGEPPEPAEPAPSPSRARRPRRGRRSPRPAPPAATTRRPSRPPTPTGGPAPTTPTPSPRASTAPSSSSEALGAQVIEEIPHQ